MTFLNVGLFALVMLLGVSGQPFQSGPSCDFTGIDVDAAVSRFLAKLPKEAVVGTNPFRTVFPGFEVGGLQISGLRLLRQFGPAIPYCVNGSRQLQVDLINNGRVFLSVPWRTCSGNEGSIMLSAGVSRFTVQLGLAQSDSARGEVNPHLLDYAPVATEELFVGVLGAGPASKPVTVVLSKMFDGVLREAWHNVFYQAFLGVLSEYPTQ